jgi:hypothetical protein
MKCDDFKKNFYDYKDQLVIAEVSLAMDNHIDHCSDCSALNRKYEDFLNRFSSLPQSIEPENDLWPEIKKKITQVKYKSINSRIRFAAIAASFVLVITFSLTMVFVNYNNSSKEAKIINQFNEASKEYNLARIQLVKALHAKEGILKKETIDIIENNLIIIDQAIGEIKVAIKKEPENQSLVIMLADTYHKETDMLLSTRDLISSIKN